MSNPVIRWMGGKSKLAGDILPMFPPHTTYIEPFCGGAALFFRKPQAKCEVLNDINGELINLYRVVQHHFDEFVRQFSYIPASRELFNQWRDSPVHGMTDIQRAARFFFLKQQNFGGKDYNITYGYSRVRNSNYRHDRVAVKLIKAHKRLCGVYIESLPWQEIFRRYDSDTSLFYCDPPYYGTERYSTDFPIHEYKELSEVMRTCKGKVLLSINDNPVMREVFDGLYGTELITTYTLHNNNQRKTELLFANYDWEAL